MNEDAPNKSLSTNEPCADGDAPASSKEQTSEPIRQRKGTKPFLEALRSSPMYNQVSGILHWQDPVQSLLLFGIGHFFFFLITYGEYSVLTLLSYLALALIAICGVYANGAMIVARFKKERVENPFLSKINNPTVVDKFSLEAHGDAVIGVINDTLELTRSVLYFTDNLFSLKVAALLWVLSVLGKLFSGTTLLYLAFLSAFVWPRVYREKKAQIDNAYELVSSKVDLYVGLVSSKIPFLKPKTE